MVKISYCNGRTLVVLYIYGQGKSPIKNLEAYNMKKIEMELKFAQEIYKLDEEYEELRDELKDTVEAYGMDSEMAHRIRHYKGKVRAKRKQTLKMAELIELDTNHIENIAFEISMTKADQEPLGINLEECLPF
jgi:chromosome segregation ATPase